MANKGDFANKDFQEDYPINQNAFAWDNFRLSLSRITTTALLSTHMKATCNFGMHGLNFTDYLKAALSEINRITSLSFDKCHRYEYINIRGYSCSNCTANFYQSRSFHSHVDSYFGTYIDHCELKTPGVEGSSLQPVKITWEISKHLIPYIGVRLLTTLPPSGGLGYNKSHVRKYYIATSFLFTEVKGSNPVQA